MALAERPDDRKLVFAGLGTADSAAALDLVEKYLGDAALRNEAALAVAQIADRVREDDAARAGAALKRALAAARDPVARQKVQDVVNELEKYDGYILAWQIAGPFEVKGKEAKDLYDTAFPPEQGDGAGAAWKPAGRGVGPWSITLDAAVGAGEDRAAYLRTRVVAPAAMEAQLEVGSDDGVKVWLNGRKVIKDTNDHGMEPRQHAAKVALRQGVNDLLVKVVNHTGGWNVCCRLRRPDGSALEGLRYEAK